MKTLLILAWVISVAVDRHIVIRGERGVDCEFQLSLQVQVWLESLNTHVLELLMRYGQEESSSVICDDSGWLAD